MRLEWRRGRLVLYWAAGWWSLVSYYALLGRLIEAAMQHTVIQWLFDLEHELCYKYIHRKTPARSKSSLFTKNKSQVKSSSYHSYCSTILCQLDPEDSCYLSQFENSL